MTWSTTAEADATSKREWWKEAVVYQIYPRSFNDSDGDGVGDLRGIVEKIDYLDDLGVDVVWLTPVYDSPQVDNGYDIRDYRSIDDAYGTMSDWEALRDGLHDRGIRLIMDLVVNHTSDEHEWFQRSRRGEGKYRDYYYWRDGSPEEPPNNWESFFGGSAWCYDEEREAWYLHLFDEKQPDLNWRNPDVREDVYEMMRWWLEKGIDGFRMDVINLISKPEGLPDGDEEGGVTGTEHFVTGPRAHEYVDEMNERVLSDYDLMTVGETLDVTVEDARQFVGENGSGLDMVFSFEHVSIDEGDEGPWDVAEWDLHDLKEVTTHWQEGLSGDDDWNSLYLSNHDQPRQVSRFGDDGEYRRESAKLLATYLHTLQGTPFVYQGEELGMTNTPFESVDEYRDEATIQKIRAAKETGRIAGYDQIKDAVMFWSRDNARTPMQWSDDEHAGFTEGGPWIKVNPNYESINVEAERGDEDSVLSYYRRLIDLRETHPVLVYGEYELLLEDDPDVFAYRRTLEDAPEELLVVLNFFDREPSFTLPANVRYDEAQLLLGNYGSPRDADPDSFDLRPYEARVYLLE